MAGRSGWIDDEVSDSDFLSSGPPKTQGGSGTNDYQQRRQQLLEERRRIEERTLQSSKMSLGLVYESEKIGLSTAEQLVQQGEKLQNVDRNLDSMNATMRVTQKHLTSMKSLFGGIKNYFGSKTPDPSAMSSSQSVPGSMGSKPNGYKSSLTETIGAISSESNSRANDSHPALVRRGLGNPFDEEEEESGKRQGPRSGYEARSRQIDKQLDDNLGELDMGLNRLKNLALGLGNEIETQNEMIERITTKAERAEDTIGHQNRQMKQILKK